MNTGIKTAFFCGLFTLSFTAGAQEKTINKVTEDSLKKYYTKLVKSTEEADKVTLETELYKLLKSKQEKDWVTAANYFYQLKKQGVSDSIVTAAKSKFPLGYYKRNEEVSEVYEEKDAVKKEKLYKAWIKKFPPEKFGTERIQYDYARNAIASAYANEDNVAKAIEYANMVETDLWKGEGWAGPASVLLKNGHNKEAKELLKKSINNAYVFKNERKNEPGAAFAVLGLPGYLSTYANILYKEKNYNEALEYMQKAYEESDANRKVNLNATYAKLLMATGRNEEAFAKLDESVKHGMATNEMKEDLKVLYVQLKGNEGYDEYMTNVNKILVAKIKSDLTKQMIKEPAPIFTLTDIDGKQVSLAELKGKTVLIDFWATWCGPCKRSFPAMKKALERYKDNDDVKFLFVHTWEREGNALEDAKKYITENNYPFQVLMDLKNNDGVNKVVESFKVEGIPTKFVIDKNGDIRFKFTGFSGGDDAAVEEVSAMIELAQKG